jgi:hypothetical protein
MKSKNTLKELADQKMDKMIKIFQEHLNNNCSTDQIKNDNVIFNELINELIDDLVLISDEDFQKQILQRLVNVIDPENVLKINLDDLKDLK